MFTKFCTKRKWSLARVRQEIEALRSIIPPFAGDPVEPIEATGDACLMAGRTNKWFLEPDERAA
jgi:hypothetical protein